MGNPFAKDDDKKDAQDLDLTNRPEGSIVELNKKRQLLLMEHHEEYTAEITKRQQLNLGFYNLGNTCYMSSVLICMANCTDLRDFVLHPQFFEHINTLNKMGTGGKLTAEFARVVKRAWNEKSEKSLSCRSFKSALSSASSTVESRNLRFSLTGGTSRTPKSFSTH